MQKIAATDMANFMLRTGMRSSEVMNLQQNDISPDKLHELFRKHVYNNSGANNQ